jgi:Kef-type K+ transport system membrane component KefB
LFFILLVLLVVTRAFGEIAEKRGQPALVGELVAGIVLGAIAAQCANVMPQIAGLDENIVFESITDLGMFFIMLFAGVELQPRRLIEYSRGSLMVAASGTLLPMALGIALGWAFLPDSDLFVAGLFFGRKTIDEPSYDEVRSKTSAMTFGFLAPIFFASVGAHLDFRAVLVVPAFVLCLLVVAFIGKFLGAGVAARGAGLSRYQAAAVGAGMSARGAVELVIADIALEAGLFEFPDDSPVVEHMFSAIVMMAVLTTLMTPILLKRIYARIPL